MDRLCDGVNANLIEIEKIIDREAELLVKAATIATQSERQELLAKYQEILELLNKMEVTLRKISRS